MTALKTLLLTILALTVSPGKPPLRKMITSPGVDNASMSWVDTPAC